MTDKKAACESLALRVVWMLLFALAWKVAELVLLLTAGVQLLLRLINGQASRALMDFGDSLSQFLGHTGRYVTFHTDHKPWPFSDWPAAREPQLDLQSLAAPVAPVVAAPVPAASVAPAPLNETTPPEEAEVTEVATPPAMPSVPETATEQPPEEQAVRDEAAVSETLAEADSPAPEDAAPAKPRRTRARKAPAEPAESAPEAENDQAPESRP